MLRSRKGTIDVLARRFSALVVTVSQPHGGRIVVGVRSPSASLSYYSTVGRGNGVGSAVLPRKHAFRNGFLNGCHDRTGTNRWAGRIRSVAVGTFEGDDVITGSRDRAATATPAVVSLAQNQEILKDIPLEDCRNFCIIAHVDHGKSSLASRLLELTGNLAPNHTERRTKPIASGNDNDNDNDVDNDNDNDNDNPTTPSSIKNDPPSPINREQISALDTLSVERERGITVKASCASMLHPHPTATNPHGLLLLNMVDTPGHADFGTEVTRTLRSVSGAVLLFDAARGVQAQSLSVFDKARSLPNVKAVLPVLTKVDLEGARPLEVALTVGELFGFDPDHVSLTSARENEGVKEVLDRVCREVPPPDIMDDDDGVTLRAKVVDSWFEPLRGVVCLVQVLSGELAEASRVTIAQPRPDGERAVYGKDHCSVQEVGLLLPRRVRTGRLGRGQMGYVVVGLRDPRRARSGTVMVLNDQLSKVMDMQLPTVPTEGGTDGQSVLYASVHPVEADGFDALSAAIDRLALNDTGLEVQRTTGTSSGDGGPFLGPGLKVGFQGLLHVEVFQQRLLDEFKIDAIVTPPKVTYKIQYIHTKADSQNGDLPTTETIEDLSKWPAQGKRFKVEEPVVDVSSSQTSVFGSHLTHSLYMQ